MTSKVTKIADLNDAMRRAGPFATSGWTMTAGVQSLGTDVVLQAVLAVQSFNNFTRDNDPYREHDFGSITVAGHKLFWKIDYYGLSLEDGSGDPANPAVTRRILTIMLASEY